MMPMMGKNKKKSFLSVAISMGKPAKTLSEMDNPKVEDAPGGMADAAAEPAAESKAYDEFELKDKARTLQDAEEIKADPELMKALQPYLSKKASALEGMKSHIKSMDDLKAVAKEKVKPY